MSNASVSASRNEVLHDYHDHAQITFTSEINMEGSKCRGAPDGMPSPAKVHAILSEVEQDGLSDILSWQVVLAIISLCCGSVAERNQSYTDHNINQLVYSCLQATSRKKL